MIKRVPTILLLKDLAFLVLPIILFLLQILTLRFLFYFQSRIKSRINSMCSIKKHFRTVFLKSICQTLLFWIFIHIARGSFLCRTLFLYDRHLRWYQINRKYDCRLRIGDRKVTVATDEWEMDPNEVDVDQKLGSGAYGVVFRGIVKWNAFPAGFRKHKGELCVICEQNH